MSKLIPVIGIEVHVEPKTQSKMFCDCSADHFKAEPNTQVCPVCLGLPGALPVPNTEALRKLALLGEALGCNINKHSFFERKHYFYPDLPKGYQISQYREPLCVNGTLEISNSSPSSNSNSNSKSKENRNIKKTVRINRAHMEEDTAKLKHSNGRTLIDFNRSGVPLIEIVSEADIGSSSEAKEYLKELARLIQWLGISEASMEKGTMRLEANVSLQEEGQFEVRDSKVIALGGYKLNPRTELKNINSFRFVEKAIDYELERQRKILESGEQLVQETRGWDEDKGITYSQREKEEAHDYRYFPEPDIPPIQYKRSKIKDQKLDMELPWEAEERLQKTFNLPYQYVSVLTSHKDILKYFDNLVVTAGKIVKDLPENERVLKIAAQVVNRKLYLDINIPKETIVGDIFKSEASNFIEVGSETIDKIIAENAAVVATYKAGKESAIQFLVGQVMKETKGKANAQEVMKILKERLV